MKQSLPGIVSISYLPCANLTTNIMERYLCGLPVSISATKTAIALVGDAECTLDAEFECNSYIEECQLEFSTTDDIGNSVSIAFVITDANGASYLIGVKEKPYPEVQIGKTIDTESNVKKIKVTFKAKKSLIIIV